jgi:hypothetical protein
MIAAGRSYLEHMGWDEHEALFLAHIDTPHPHMHIILNRVHPETGMTLDDAWSRRRAQEWALAYERAHGRIYCHEREAKYGRGERSHARHFHYGEWAYRQQAEWAMLKASQRQDRIGFWTETSAARRELHSAVRDEVRAEFAPEWRAYALRKIEKQDAARRFDQETRRALRYYLRLHGVEAVRKLKERRKKYYARQREELTKKRQAINSRIQERTKDRLAPALDHFAQQRRALYQELLARHREDRAKLRKDQSLKAKWDEAGQESTDPTREKEGRAIEREARRRERIDRRIAERAMTSRRGRDRDGPDRQTSSCSRSLPWLG